MQYKSVSYSLSLNHVSLFSERIEELRKFMAEAKSIYMKEKEEIYLVQNGQADDRLEEMQLSIVE